MPTDGSRLSGRPVQYGIAFAERIDAEANPVTILATFMIDTHMLEHTPPQYRAHAITLPRKLLAPTQRMQQASYAKRSRSSVRTPTRQSSILRRRKAET